MPLLTILRGTCHSSQTFSTGRRFQRITIIRGSRPILWPWQSQCVSPFPRHSPLRAMRWQSRLPSAAPPAVSSASIAGNTSRPMASRWILRRKDNYAKSIASEPPAPVTFSEIDIEIFVSLAGHRQRCESCHLHDQGRAPLFSIAPNADSNGRKATPVVRSDTPHQHPDPHSIRSALLR
jgi:hypothetical protein